MEEQEGTWRAVKIDALVEEIEAGENAELRNKTLELLQSLLRFYDAGLVRMGALGAKRDAAPPHAMVQDESSAHVLLLHGLHPLPVEVRVARALQNVRPYLRSHDGDVELLSLEDRVVRVRLYESYRGSPSSLERAIEDAIQKVAPELNGIVTERVTALSHVP
jgi:Fe-S cluster biogenesis protein NfuA